MLKIEFWDGYKLLPKMSIPDKAGPKSQKNQMRTKSRNSHLPSSLSLLLLLVYLSSDHRHAPFTEAQAPNTNGFTCARNDSCRTYAFYRATAPNLLDLASIGDLFFVSRLMISNPSNISSPSLPLVPNQPLFVPLTCSCNSINSSLSLSFAKLNYTIQKGDTFYYVSTSIFQNLTTFQSVEVVNPTLIPTLLEIGVTAVFPIFCKCPNKTQLQNGHNLLISYVVQPSDTLSFISASFGSSPKSITDVNGKNGVEPFETIFVPVARLPVLNQPRTGGSPPTSGKNDEKGVVIGLGIGLGICGILLVLSVGFWFYREAMLRKDKKKGRGDEEMNPFNERRKGYLRELKVNLMADVSDCLDKYRVYEIEELKEATNGFDQKWLVQGSVYKGYINEGLYAIKKMKWNACEELKILQKVNHGNLVKLEGFCIDPEDASCYLVYEYAENGSLHTWLHGKKTSRLNWKARLRIAIDVANGLQYIHEHTRPRVVHKDIKSSNILLDASMRAKIANFGLAKSGCNAITMHIVGTQGYIAPEYLTDGVVSMKMDVFSFGVVLLELVSGTEAIDGEGKLLWMSVNGILDGSEERKEKRVKNWMDRSLADESGSIESILNAMNVAVACLHRDPAKRPSMVDVVYALCKGDDLFFDISQDGLSPRQVLAR